MLKKCKIIYVPCIIGMEELSTGRYHKNIMKQGRNLIAHMLSNKLNAIVGTKIYLLTRKTVGHIKIYNQWPYI